MQLQILYLGDFEDEFQKHIFRKSKIKKSLII